VRVVVLAIDAEDVLKMAPSEDEDPVETLDSERTYPAFGVRCARAEPRIGA
jgi:hypothetical protein